jgi:hypothetical protein
MSVHKHFGSVIAMTLASIAVACSGSDEGSDPGAAATAGTGAGATTGTPGSGSGPSAIDGADSVGDDGTQFFGNFPVFPGAGTSDEAKPLENGMVCDAVAGADIEVPEEMQICFFGLDDPDHTKTAATLEQVLECVEEADTVHLRLTFHPWFVDNTYGENQLGWIDEEASEPVMDPMAMDPMAMDPMAMDPMAMRPKAMPKPKAAKGHTFGDLVGSDHAEIVVTDGAGKVVLQFKLDYISADASAASGYASLGVTGGEGKVLVGDAADVVKWMTSIDRNLNERGYASYTTDSPATDDLYSPNDDTPEWDYRVVYEAWIDIEAFGDAGFGGASIEFVHASPSKADSNTIEVEPGDCPPPPCTGTDPDATCGDDEPPPDDPPPDSCVDNDPDTFCSDAGVPPTDEGPDCEMFPDQCMVD